jgi:hypothetical protein
LALACVGSRGLRQLALIGQSCHLGGHRVGDGLFVVIIIVIAKDAKRILLVRQGRGMPVMTCGEGCCIETTL